MARSAPFLEQAPADWAADQALAYHLIRAVGGNTDELYSAVAMGHDPDASGVHRQSLRSIPLAVGAVDGTSGAEKPWSVGFTSVSGAGTGRVNITLDAGVARDFSSYLVVITYEGLTLAITSADGGELVGAISLMQINQDNQRAVLGYWIGHEYWGNGYCTEAAGEIVRFGFEELALNRVVASHLTRNPASGRVMQKIGMVHEGTFRQDIKKWGKFEDIERYGLLASEWKDGR